MQLQLVIGNVSLPQLIRLQKLFSPATSTHCMHHFRFTVQQCVCVNVQRVLHAPLTRPLTFCGGLSWVPCPLAAPHLIDWNCSPHLPQVALAFASRAGAELRPGHPSGQASATRTARTARTAVTDGGQSAQFSANYRRSLHFGQYVRCDAMCLNEQTVCSWAGCPTSRGIQLIFNLGWRRFYCLRWVTRIVEGILSEKGKWRNRYINR